MSSAQNKPQAATHMLYFFILPCVGFVIWAAIKLGGAMVETQSPKDAFDRLTLLKSARNSGDRWQAAYGLSQEIHRMMRDKELDNLSEEKKNTLYSELKTLLETNASDARLKRYLLLTLGQMGDSLALPSLESALDDPDNEIRFFSAWGFIDILRKHPEEKTPARLDRIFAWIDLEDTAFQKIAATFLVQEKNPRYTQGVRKQLSNQNVEVRWNAAVALASMNEDGATETLAEIFDLENLRALNLKTSKDLAQLLAAAYGAALKLGDETIIDAAQKLRSQSNPKTPEGRAIHAAITAKI